MKLLRLAVIDLPNVHLDEILVHIDVWNLRNRAAISVKKSIVHFPYNEITLLWKNTWFCLHSGQFLCSINSSTTNDSVLALS